MVKILSVAPNVSPIVTVGYSIDSSTVAIQWTPPPPEDHNGIIREYRVLITNVNTGENETRVFSSNTGIIGMLTPSYVYKLSVTAVTVAEGPYSTSITITLPEDGEKFTALLKINIIDFVLIIQFPVDIHNPYRVTQPHLMVFFCPGHLQLMKNKMASSFNTLLMLPILILWIQCNISQPKHSYTYQAWILIQHTSVWLQQKHQWV